MAVTRGAAARGASPARGAASEAAPRAAAAAGAPAGPDDASPILETWQKQYPMPDEAKGSAAEVKMLYK